MISVVVPAYNAADTLPACLSALQNQTCPPDQIIVVDDGSTDETALLSSTRAILVLHQENRGPAAARNLGLQQAQGGFVLFTDADCEPAPHWIEEMVRPFATENVHGVKGSYRTLQTQVVARLAQCEFEERYDRLEQYASIDFVDSHAAAFRVETLRGIGAFDVAFPQANNEDVDLSYRLASGGFKLVFNRQAVVYHRHPATWFAYWKTKAQRGYWRMVVYRLHPAKALSDTYTPQLLKFQVLLVFLIIGWLLGAIVRSPLLGAALVSFAGLLVSAIPFIRQVARHDPGVIVWAPVFVVVRAVAFAIGVMAGSIGMFLFHPSLRRAASQSLRG